MKRLLAAALPAALASAGATPALAADAGLPPLPAIAEPAPTAPVGSGWYLRGDIGYTAHRDPDVRLQAPGFDEPVPGETIDDAVAAGMGVGYRLNSWLRGDVTVDHRFPTHATLVHDREFDIRIGSDLASTVLLANGYLDLGSWHGFTPYVGAGLGYSWNSLSDVHVNDLAIAIDRKTQGGFAYAFMAGVAVDLGRSLQLDLGYRYLNLGEARTAPLIDTSFVASEIEAHEARLGVRWVFDQRAIPAPLARSF